jgi:hypothetical protein
MGLVSRAGAQGALATATATLNYNMTTSNWTAGHATYEDDDGNYNYVGLQPNFSVNAQVTTGTTPYDEEGTILITQPFSEPSPSGPYPALTFDSVATATASAADASQSASARGCHQWNGSSGFGMATAGVVRGTPGTDGPHSVTDHVTVYLSVNSYTDTGMVQAHAAEVGQQGGGGGGGCSYKSTSPNKKVFHGLRPRNERATL